MSKLIFFHVPVTCAHALFQCMDRSRIWSRMVFSDATTKTNFKGWTLVKLKKFFVFKYASDTITIQNFSYTLYHNTIFIIYNLQQVNYLSS
jgi:hypothetical protein